MPQKVRRAKANVAMPTVNPHAAGMDIGAKEIYVAVPADSAPDPVRSCTTFTDDLRAIADWLKACGVKTVAMESTGVYWIPIFQILEAAGFEVCLVNSRHVKNVPGRKTDVSDAQWLQYLHAVGLLRVSFRPPEAICALRSVLRHRDSLGLEPPWRVVGAVADGFGPLDSFHTRSIRVAGKREVSWATPGRSVPSTQRF
jgi:hypothetical protein